MIPIEARNQYVRDPSLVFLANVAPLGMERASAWLSALNDAGSGSPEWGHMWSEE